MTAVDALVGQKVDYGRVGSYGGNSNNIADSAMWTSVTNTYPSVSYSAAAATAGAL